MGLQRLARLSWREGQADLLGSTAHQGTRRCYPGHVLTHPCLPGLQMACGSLKAGEGHGPFQSSLEVGGGGYS